VLAYGKCLQPFNLISNLRYILMTTSQLTHTPTLHISFPNRFCADPLLKVTLTNVSEVPCLPAHISDFVQYSGPLILVVPAG
jgi:hypothetical protein